MQRYMLIATGGVVGCVARYWLAGLVQNVGSVDFPTGTLAVNVLGSLVIGVIMALSIDRGLIDADLRILLTTGFCGGFTTMSTFSYETLALLRAGQPWLAFGNVAITNAACFLAVWLGSAVARFT